ncbi:hypothetical protein CQA53_00180 [Helicobacter didelphidarum]|uniref:Uncharacterized protein n=1 Tax=Helicobacter didelphidarum TaxID=2040648 RepID=A0A3D8IRF2_9HELI|nr:hypothetical protein [Helicobacter didelphidarum]RDU67485.1 hypothetical protein CQA53_00180 [Helicobacter didelphidarum]
MQLGIAHAFINGGINNPTQLNDVAYRMAFDLEIGKVIGSLTHPIIVSMHIPFKGNFVAPHFRDRKMQVALGKDVNLEYKIGYGYNIMARHKSYSFNKESWFKEGGHRLEASLAVILGYGIGENHQERRKKLDFYAKLKGVYHRINPFNIMQFDGTIHTYPASNNFLLLFEFGIGLDWRY